MWSHYNVKCTSFIPPAYYHIFFNSIPKHIDAFVPSGKTNIVSDGAFAFINVHKHNFHYCGISYLENVALDAQTVGWLFQKFPVKWLQHLVPNMCCMGFHSCAEGSCVTDNLFRLWKQHLGGIWFFCKEEVEMAVYEWMVLMHQYACRYCWKIMTVWWNKCVTFNIVTASHLTL
jgi:hypothetical protein